MAFTQASAAQASPLFFIFHFSHLSFTGTETLFDGIGGDDTEGGFSDEETTSDETSTAFEANSDAFNALQDAFSDAKAISSQAEGTYAFPSSEETSSDNTTSEEEEGIFSYF